MKATFTNNKTGQIKQCKVGFSWTFFFWGWWVCLFRGDWKWLFISLIAGAFTFGIFDFVLAFMYNKIYINDLIDDGYLPSNDSDRTMIAQKGYVSNTVHTADEENRA